MHTGSPGDLPQEVNIPTEIDGGAIYEGVDPQGHCLPEVAAGQVGHPGGVEILASEIIAHRQVCAGDMLMDEHAAQILGRDRAKYCINHSDASKRV